MPETLTAEDVAMLREAQERLRDRAATLPIAAPPMPASGAFLRGDAPEVAQLVPRCQGGCGGQVRRRGEWCLACGTAGRRLARELEVSAARETFSPGGAAGWCRPGDPAYTAAVAKAAGAASPDLARLITHAAWRRDMGSALILGPTDFGKTRVLCAIGNRVLDYAVKVGWSQPDIMRFARGVRYVSALDIGRARSQGKWEEPEIVRSAKNATLLLLDEFGWEEQRFDPHAVRDILRARFDPVWKPTIVASGETYERLAEKYGEPTLRMITCRGLLLDLHPRKAA
jgi:hypothetical protein